MRLTDFDVLTFDMIGTLIDFERGILDFMNPRILRVRPDRPKPKSSNVMRARSTSSAPRSPSCCSASACRRSGS